MLIVSDIRAIEVPGSGPAHDEISLALLKHVEVMYVHEGCSVFYQHPPFLSDRVLSAMMG